MFWFASSAVAGIMPSFAEALTAEQIAAVVKYLRGFCRATSYPRGELNLPRALATEKAFPEDEAVITTALAAHNAPDVNYEFVYERRLAARTQLELSVPFSSVHDENGAVAHGVGDLGVGVKQVLFAGANAILGAQGEIIMPTGNQARGLGTGTTVFEAFASYGQLLPSHMFLQAQIGTEQPTSTDEFPRVVFGRAARTNVDVLPQFQVTLNQRQHVRANVGIQFPVNNTAGRSKQVVFYVLWDWFDGGLLEGWK